MTEEPVRRKDEPEPAEPPADGLGRRELTAGVKRTAIGANVFLGALSTTLAVWTEGVGRWLLGALVVLSVLVFLSQVGVAGVRLRHRSRLRLAETRHKQELAAAREELAQARERATEHAAAAAAELAGLEVLRSRHTAVLAALHDMWLGYPAPYTDEVELTYLVGNSDDGDRVVEHRRTCPSRGASLPFLLGRLTTPTQLDAEAVSLADIDMVTRSEDDRTAIRQIALSEAPGLLRCMFVFRPAISQPVSWYARYRMPGMWSVLRASGHDRLAWTPAAQVTDPDRSTLSRLAVNFDFPPEAGDDVFVRDRDNRELKRLTGPDGSLRYRWEIDRPLPERYTWDLWWARSPEGTRRGW